MPLPVNKIVLLDSGGGPTGENLYQAIRIAPQWASMQTELLTFPGIDGVGIRELGIRGEPFEIVTMEYRDSLTSARTAAQDYLSYIASGAPYGIRVIQRDVDQGVYGVMKIALAAEPRPIGAAVNSLIVNPNAMLLMRWLIVHQ
jgi:hypothetical protein